MVEKLSWYIHWDPSFDLARGGIELSFRSLEDMSNLLVETDTIRLTSRIIDKIVTPYISPRYHIIGTRGYGKSTVLNFMAFRLFSNLENQKAIPVYASLLGKARDEKELEFIFFRSLLESLFDVPADMVKFRLNETFARSVEQLTKAEREYKTKIKKFGEVSLEFVYSAFENQLRHLRQTFNKIVFLLDGLDKQETDVVLEFFRNTQERLNNIITKYNCMFIDAADPSWRETLETREYSGVRGNPINLRGWTADEVEALIKNRLEKIGIYQMPFKRKAVEILVEDFQGNPREILQYSTTLLHYSAKEHLRSIGSGVARKVVWGNDSKEKFYNLIIGDADVRYAFEKLKALYNNRQMMNILIAAFNQRGYRLSKSLNYESRSAIGITLTDADFRRFLSILTSKGCLKISRVQNYVELENDCIKLFDFVAKMGESLVALPVILGELEFKVERIATLPKEEIIIKDEIQRVLEHHPSGWFDYKRIKELLLENPRTKKKLQDHYKEDYVRKVKSIIPLIINNLAENEKLMYDEATTSYRWRPQAIDSQIANTFRDGKILDFIDSTKKSIVENNMRKFVISCKAVFYESFSRLNALFGSRIGVSTPDIAGFLKHSDVNVSKPVPLNLFLSSLKEEPHASETEVLLETAILYARRIFSKIRQLNVYEPKNQEIKDRLKRSKVGTFKEKERHLFKTIFLPTLLQNYGKLVECMSAIKMEPGFLKKVPANLKHLLEGKQMLPAELYECPKCKKQTTICATEIRAMNCPEDRVPLIKQESVYILSENAYQAWNVWIEEYAKAMLEELPCQYVESGIALKPVEIAGVASPEEVDLVVVFNGKSIAIECIERIVSSSGRNDVEDVIFKMQGLGLFDAAILIYRQIDNQQAFNALIKKHQNILFPLIVQNPKILSTALLKTLQLAATVRSS